MSNFLKHPVHQYNHQGAQSDSVKLFPQKMSDYAPVRTFYISQNGGENLRVTSKYFMV